MFISLVPTALSETFALALFFVVLKRCIKRSNSRSVVFRFDGTQALLLLNAPCEDVVKQRTGAAAKYGSAASGVFCVQFPLCLFFWVLLVFGLVSLFVRTTRFASWGWGSVSFEFCQRTTVPRGTTMAFPMTSPVAPGASSWNAVLNLFTHDSPYALGLAPTGARVSHCILLAYSCFVVVRIRTAPQ